MIEKDCKDGKCTILDLSDEKNYVEKITATSKLTKVREGEIVDRYKGRIFKLLDDLNAYNRDDEFIVRQIKFTIDYEKEFGFVERNDVLAQFKYDFYMFLFLFKKIFGTFMTDIALMEDEANHSYVAGKKGVFHYVFRIRKGM